MTPEEILEKHGLSIKYDDDRAAFIEAMKEYARHEVCTVLNWVDRNMDVGGNSLGKTAIQLAKDLYND
jgi:hypothetical protein